MKDTQQGYAKLEEVEPETVQLFLEFVYTGLYRVAEEITEPSASRGFRIRTTSGPFTVKAKNFDVNATATDIELGLHHAALHNGISLEILDCRVTTRHPHVVASIVFAKSDIANDAVMFFHRQTFGKQIISAELMAKTSRQSAFEKRKYDVGKIKHKDFSKNLRYQIPAVSFSGKLLPHAKLWVFADRYLVNDLKDLCLHMLCRELLLFKINADTVFQIFELLSYVYDPENTCQSDKDTSGNGEEGYVNKLRDLVISYAACIINELQDFKEFKETLREGGNLAVKLGTLSLTS